MAARLDLPVGARVLTGLPGISDPGDWRHATVLWTDGAEVLLRKADFGGKDWNDLVPITNIRAIGDRAFLEEFRVAAAREIAGLRGALKAAKDAVEEARAAMWARLDEIGATRLGIEPASSRATRRRKAARKRIGMTEDA